MSATPSSSDRDSRRTIHPTADMKALLDRFADESLAFYLRIAQAEIRRRGINEIGLAAAGAVNRAWGVLCRRIAEGKISPTPEDLRRVFPRLISHVLQDEQRRQKAGKRDRSRLVHLSSLDGTGFDRAAAEADRPDRRVSGAEWVEWLLGLLDRTDPSLRAVAVMKADGLTNQEIASRLGKSVSFVKRQLERIRTILAPYRDEDR